MSCIIWNIRGIANDTSLGRLKFLARHSKANMLVVIEPMIESCRAEAYRKKLRMDCVAVNDESNANIQHVH